MKSIAPVVHDLVKLPDWARELDARLSVNAQLVLAGNVNDLHVASVPTQPGPSWWSTIDLVAERLCVSGYQFVVVWNPVEGFVLTHDDGAVDRPDVLDEFLQVGVEDRTAGRLAEVLTTLVGLGDMFRIGLIIDSAPLLCSTSADPELHSLYVAARHMSYRAPRCRLASDVRGGLVNTVLWLVDREADLPHWLLASEQVHILSIPRPNLHVRSEAAGLLAGNFPGYSELLPGARTRSVTHFAEASEGLSVGRMRQAVVAALELQIPVERLEEAVRFVRSGLQVSPWQDPDIRQRITHSTQKLNDAVLGQQRAVQKVVDALSRAVLGLTGAQNSGHPNRPQGVLFFAGPTGVGKTELAKQIASLVFGRDEAMVRFDMSEFTAEHSEARLIGSPPGYIGHESGGELTNALRRDPFRLLLFDEVDKAHPRILDKFLQILEDGRLTDGAGGTVFFGETLIVFTSNLKVREPSPKTSSTNNVGQNAESYEAAVRRDVWRMFDSIERPELLNRIGNNVVVFDRMNPDIAKMLLRRALATVAARLYDRTGQRVSFSEEAMTTLEELVVEPATLAFGGRAVYSLVESRVVNPLARRLLATPDAGSWDVREVIEEATGAQLVFENDPATILPLTTQ